jgi:hypothetical protein
MVEMHGINMGIYRFNKETQKWIKLTSENERTDWDIPIDDKLFTKLMYVKKHLRKNLDFPIIITGAVGSGKSNIARLCCRIISDEHFHPKTHIIKDAKDVEPVFERTKKYEGIIFDEGSALLSGVDTMKKETKWIQKVFDQCRGQNLFIAILAPNFHSIKQDIAVERTNGLIRTYFDKRSGNQGPFAFYGKKKKSIAYAIAKKEHGIYRKVKPNFRGTAGKDKTFTQEYLDVKNATFKSLLSDGPIKKDGEKKILTPKEVIKKYNISLVVNLVRNGKTRKEISNILPFSIPTIDRYIKEDKDNQLIANNTNTTL